MKMIASISTALAFLAVAHSPGLSDCVDMTEPAGQGTHKGIAKDGTHSPMEGSTGQIKTESSTGTTTTSRDAATPKTAQKDGNKLPIGESNNLATSGQDVSAQQKGDKTAAATAAQGACK